MSYDEEKVRLKPDGSEERNKQLQCVGKHTNCCIHQGQSVHTLSQLSETSQGDVHELPPEDKVEGELLYYQLQPFVTTDPRKHDTLMFRKLQQVEHFPNNSAKYSHRNLFWDRKEGNERERNTDGVRRRFYPMKVIIRLQNQVIDDSMINLNNLTVQPPSDLLTHPFGSYLVLKQLEACTKWYQKIQDVPSITKRLEAFIKSLSLSLFIFSVHSLIEDLSAYGLGCDWRWSFVTTDVNPFFDAFVRWQMRKLKSMGKIDKDREDVQLQESTLIKMEVAQSFPLKLGSLEGKRVFLTAATLRPETMYGQTNAWVLPDGKYGAYEINETDVFILTAADLIHEPDIDLKARHDKNMPSLFPASDSHNQQLVQPPPEINAYNGGQIHVAWAVVD